jgi:3-methyladenine DNA glycosylase/8-oxoguanine DNA glycosylase
MSLDKREVIPVDTHVHQIAAKHYGIKAKGGGKGGAKRPYDEVNEKLAAIWGPYAGWAHSVSIHMSAQYQCESQPFSGTVHCRSQVLRILRAGHTREFSYEA